MLVLTRKSSAARTAARSCARTAAAPLLFAAVTGLLAGVRVPLPFTPVPLTGQVAGVLLAGFYLGGGRAAASQVLYLALGLAGLPWFSGWNTLSPAMFLAGPTGGYLAGFVPAAWLVGVLSNRAGRSPARLGGAFCAGILVIHLGGALRLAWLLGASPGETLALAVFPFLYFDFLKALLVVTVVTGRRPAFLRPGAGDDGGRSG